MRAWIIKYRDDETEMVVWNDIPVTIAAAQEARGRKRVDLHNAGVNKKANLNRTSIGNVFSDIAERVLLPDRVGVDFVVETKDVETEEPNDQRMDCGNKPGEHTHTHTHTHTRTHT